MEAKRPEKSRLDRILEIPEMNIKGKKKDYPSINDYYKAASRDEKPIQYQHGLSNYSNVLLGDDRVSFKKSLSQDAYSLDDIEHEEPEKQVHGDAKTEAILYKQRKEDYAEANEVVGLNKIHEMEQMMCCNKREKQVHDSEELWEHNMYLWHMKWASSFGSDRSEPLVE